MENAADALKMAGAVLIFVLALSIIILFFSQVRTTSDSIINMKDRETAYIDGDYYVKEVETRQVAPRDTFGGTGTQPVRKVGIETIVQTVTRAFLENYKILFYDAQGNPMTMYTLRNGTQINYIDLESRTDKVGKINNVTLGSDAEKIEFFKAFFYNDFGNVGKNEIMRKYYIQSFEYDNGLFSAIKDKYKEFYEFFGVYYQNDKDDIPEIMKTEKRILIYKAVN